MVRSADEELYRAMHSREFAYVLTSRQMGKSSLMVRTAMRLRDEGATVVLLDLTAFGLNLTVSQWYYSLAEAVAQSTIGAREFAVFASDSPDVPPLQFFIRMVEASIPAERPLFLFLDEIDTVLSLPFSTDELFAAIRQLYNRRSEVPALQRLSLCLLGVASPSDLIRDTRTTPFNIGQRIELRDFTVAEALFLAPGLPGTSAARVRLLKRVYAWTSGHPYLTQRCCKALAERESFIVLPDVEKTCQLLFESPRSKILDDNLTFVRERLLNSGHDRTRVLLLYKRILRRRKVENNETDPIQNILLLSGAVTVSVAGILQVRNRIYRRAFDSKWVDANLPDIELRRRRQAFRHGLALAGVVAIVVITVIGYLANTVRKQRDESRLQLYLATLNLAQSAWQEHDTHKAIMLLQSNFPRAHDPDLRGFEWYALWNRVHADRPLVSYENVRGIPAAVIGSRAEPRLLALTDKYDVVELGADKKSLVGRGVSLKPTEYVPCATSDGHILTVDSNDGVVRAAVLRDESSGFEFRYPITTLSGNRERLYSVLGCSSDGQTFATYDHDEVSLYSIKTGAKTFRHPVHDRVLRFAFSSDARLIAMASRTTLEVWSADFSRQVTSAPVNQPGTLAFCPQNRCIAWPDYNGVHVWSLKGVHEIALLPSRGLDGYVDISPDGKLLASSRFDGVTVWNIESGKSIRTFQPYPITSVVRFSRALSLRSEARESATRQVGVCFYF